MTNTNLSTLARPNILDWLESNLPFGESFANAKAEFERIENRPTYRDEYLTVLFVLHSMAGRFTTEMMRATDTETMNRMRAHEIACEDFAARLGDYRRMFAANYPA